MTTRNAPAVVLVRPSEPGNIGATARAMANTGLDELIIVEPAAAIDRTAFAFAVGARPILEQARRHRSFDEAIAPFQQLIGTSSQRSRDPKTQLLTPHQLAELFQRRTQPRSALLFGPERSGLTTEELARCSLLVRIPTARRQPTLNLAQAVLIVTHELFIAGEPPQGGPETSKHATAGETEGLLAHLQLVLGSVGFDRDDTFPAVFRDIRRLAARARLRRREVSILRGILRRAEYHLAGSAVGSPEEE